MPLPINDRQDYRSNAKLYRYQKAPRKSTIYKGLFLKVPGAGLEPARPKGHMALNHACLPISAPGHWVFALGSQIYQHLALFQWFLWKIFLATSSPVFLPKVPNIIW